MRERHPCPICVINKKANGYPVTAGETQYYETNTKGPSVVHSVPCSHCEGKGWVWMTVFTPEEKAWTRLRDMGKK